MITIRLVENQSCEKVKKKKETKFKLKNICHKCFKRQLLHIRAKEKKPDQYR